MTYRDDPAIIAALGPREYADGLVVKREHYEQINAELSAALAAQPLSLPSDVVIDDVYLASLSSGEFRALAAAFFDVVVVRKHPSRSQRLPIVERVRFVPRGAIDSVGGVPRGGPTLVSFDWTDEPADPWIAACEPSLKDSTRDLAIV